MRHGRGLALDFGAGDQLLLALAAASAGFEAGRELLLGAAVPALGSDFIAGHGGKNKGKKADDLNFWVAL